MSFYHNILYSILKQAFYIFSHIQIIEVLILRICVQYLHTWLHGLVAHWFLALLLTSKRFNLYKKLRRFL
jgi:hypothetical protein